MRGASLRRKRYSVASRHSVGSPRTERCSVPSVFRSLGPTTAASGCASANCTSLSSPSSQHPGVRVEQEEVAAVCGAHAGVVAAAHAPVLLLDHAHLRGSARARARPCRRSSRCRRRRVVAGHRVEALLEPRQRVPGDDDDADVRRFHRAPPKSVRRRSPRGSRRRPGARAGSSSGRRGSRRRTPRRRARRASRGS